MRTIDNRGELEALLIGLDIMGTGGGGDPKGWGKSVFEADRKAMREYTLVNPEEVPDDALVISGGYWGSVAEDIALDRVVARWESDFELETAIRILEAEHGREADLLVPFELGGGNTPVVMSCACRMGISVVDGDGIGRAAPETHMSSFLGHGVSLTPMPLVGLDGSVVLVREGDFFLADEVGRCVASHTKGFIANAHYSMSGKQLKQSVVPGSISRALALGTYVRDLQLKGEAALDAVSQFLEGYPLLYSKVRNVSGESTGGFYVARVNLKGLGRYTGGNLDLVVKNEVMCVKRGNRPIVLFPDFVLLLNPQTLEGVMTPDLTEGREVLVIGVPCHSVVREALDSPLGTEAFSSARYGESVEYVPIEELLAKEGL
jgi:DUF917 family protein